MRPDRARAGAPIEMDGAEETHSLRASFCCRNTAKHPPMGSSSATSNNVISMTSSPTARLDELSLGFRQRFLSYDELTRQVQSWADAFPALCRTTSIGRTPEGRELWLLTLGPDPERARRAPG
jgi:hypothetical protein